MDNSNLSSDVCDSDIETNPVGNVTISEPPTAGVTGAVGRAGAPTSAGEIEKGEMGESKETNGKTHDQAKSLDDFIIKALEKVKNYFIQNKIEEHRLAEIMHKILTFNMKDVDLNELETEFEVLDKLFDQIFESSEITNDPDNFDKQMEDLFGEDIAKTINEKLCTENIDEIVEGLLGKDTKNIICNRLDSDNLDELFNKLIEEKLNAESNPLAKHPNFDEFVEKILGKETKDFIRQKLQLFERK